MLNYSMVELIDISKNILGSEVTNVQPAGAGANSRIYQVNGKNNFFALKFFRSEENKSTLRLDREVKALKLMSQIKELHCPLFIGADSNNNCCITEWISGERIKNHDLSDIRQASQFLHILNEQRFSKDAQNIDLGAEVCLAPVNIENQIYSRLQRLMASDSDQLKLLLEISFYPSLDKTVRWAKEEYFNQNMEYDTALSNNKLSLSPVDFGLHNALKTESGRLYFLDFEYFGWSDPVHLVSDTLLHPGMDLNLKQKKTFFKSMKNTYTFDDEYLSRIRILYPLYGLRWCAIMLNIFLPNYLDSFPSQLSQEDKLKMQEERLERVANRLDEINNLRKVFPY